MEKNMMTVKEAAEKWQISLRRVQDLCSNGRVDGAVLFGKNWMIPAGAPRPMDGRSKAARAWKESPHPLPRKSPNLMMTDLYHTPGCGEKTSRSLQNNPPAKLLFDGWLAYCRGEIDTAYHLARNLLDERYSFYTVTGAIMLLSLCAVWRGDIELWNEARMYISHVPCRRDVERETLSMVLTASNLAVFDYNSYPAWFERGSFEQLHPDFHPFVKVYYTQYLYIGAYGVASRQYIVEGVEGLALMRLVPHTMEPLISQAVVDKTVLSELRMRLWCAAAYHNAGQRDLAVEHIDKAIALALPDRLYGTLAAHGRNLDKLLVERLALADREAAAEVSKLYRSLFAGQSRLAGLLRNREVAVQLTTREREIAKLAAFRMTNKAIAKTLGIGESTVKSTIQNIMQKTGLTDREEFSLIL